MKEVSKQFKKFDISLLFHQNEGHFPFFSNINYEEEK